MTTRQALSGRPAITATATVQAHLSFFWNKSEAGNDLDLLRQPENTDDFHERKSTPLCVKTNQERYPRGWAGANAPAPCQGQQLKMRAHTAVPPCIGVARPAEARSVAQDFGGKTHRAPHIPPRQGRVDHKNFSIGNVNNCTGFIPNQCNPQPLCPQGSHRACRKRSRL